MNPKDRPGHLARSAKTFRGSCRFPRCQVIVDSMAIEPLLAAARQHYQATVSATDLPCREHPASDKSPASNTVAYSYARKSRIVTSVVIDPE